MIRKLTVIIALLAGTPVHAVETSPRPVARPGSVIEFTLPQRPASRRALIATPQTVVPVRPQTRPFQRPDLVTVASANPQLRAEQNLFAFSPNAPALSLRPERRSAEFIQAMANRQAIILRGQLCGDPAIQGTIIGNVPGNGACGIDSAVEVKSVAGVILQPAARMDCTTASALKRWVSDGVMPATDNQAVSLRVVGGYACRNRNAAASGKLSEHAFGRAIDIAGIGLNTGREITVLTGWNSKRDSAALRRMWQAACGPFGTVLGPNANAQHRDHFHFDTARYRSGSYCR